MVRPLDPTVEAPRTDDAPPAAASSLGRRGSCMDHFHKRSNTSESLNPDQALAVGGAEPQPALASLGGAGCSSLDANLRLSPDQDSPDRDDAAELDTSVRRLSIDDDKKLLAGLGLPSTCAPEATDKAAPVRASPTNSCNLVWRRQQQDGGGWTTASDVGATSAAPSACASTSATTDSAAINSATRPAAAPTAAVAVDSASTGIATGPPTVLASSPTATAATFSGPVMATLPVGAIPATAGASGRSVSSILQAPMLVGPPPGLRRVPRRNATVLSAPGHMPQLCIDVSGMGAPPVRVPFMCIDTTGDGHADAMLADTDLDGRADALVLDTSGNGTPDTAIGCLCFDMNGDGVADVLLVDTTEDGHADTLIRIFCARAPTAVAQQPVPQPQLAQPAAPKLAQTAAPQIVQPAAPKLAQPAAPQLAQSAAPQLAQTAAPQLAQPAAPKLAQPAAPQLAQSAAPQRAQTAAPQMAQPAAPQRAQPPPPPPPAPPPPPPPPQLVRPPQPPSVPKQAVRSAQVARPAVRAHPPASHTTTAASASAAFGDPATLQQAAMRAAAPPPFAFQNCAPPFPCVGRQATYSGGALQPPFHSSKRTLGSSLMPQFDDDVFGSVTTATGGDSMQHFALPGMGGMGGMAGLPPHAGLPSFDFDPTGVYPDAANYLPGQKGKGKIDGNLLKHGWTPEEDETIVRMVEITGQKWSFIANALPGRTDDAVRNRYLRLQKKKHSSGEEKPHVTTADLSECQATKKGDMWTAEEDAKIMDGVRQNGFKWQMIASDLPGRSANAVRNRYLRCAPAHGVPGAEEGKALGAPIDMLSMPDSAAALLNEFNEELGGAGLGVFWDAAALYGEALESIQDEVGTGTSGFPRGH